MAPTLEEAEAHLALLDQLDINAIQKPFRNPDWKPNQRRNKNIKNILGETVRKEASLAATQENAGTGTTTPNLDDSVLSIDGNAGSIISKSCASQLSNLSHASKTTSKMAIEKNTRLNSSFSAHTLSYSSIESAPSLAHTKHYCDITGLPAPYTDPKTRLRYHDKEVFGIIRNLGPGVAEQYLEARGAHTILK